MDAMEVHEVRNVQDRFPGLLDAAPDAIVIVDQAGRIVLLNSQVEVLFCYSTLELLGQLVEILVPPRFRPFHSSHRNGFFADPRIRPMGSGLELYGIRKDGTEFPVEISLRPIVTDEGILAAAAIRDISERKAVEIKLRSSLKEKEVLLREVHHRVKNNLQIVSSMLHLQMGHIADVTTIDLFKASQSRVRSIALFHEKLYQSRDLARVDIAEYLKALAAGLFATYEVDLNRIGLSVDIDDLPMGVDAAISVGLIVNELVTNSLKHAFANDLRGEIGIGLWADGEKSALLQVTDNGRGIPEGVDVRNATTLGLRLVSLFVEQLHGAMVLDRNTGAKFIIRFELGRAE